MHRFAGIFTATIIALAVAAPASHAQDQKKERVHKGTAEQGSVQKKEQKKAAKKDGSGKAKAAEKK